MMKLSVDKSGSTLPKGAVSKDEPGMLRKSFPTDYKVSQNLFLVDFMKKNEMTNYNEPKS